MSRDLTTIDSDLATAKAATKAALSAETNARLNLVTVEIGLGLRDQDRREQRRPTSTTAAPATTTTPSKTYTSTDLKAAVDSLLPLITARKAAQTVQANLQKEFTDACKSAQV